MYRFKCCTTHGMTPPLITDCADVDARRMLSDRLTRSLLDLRKTIEADLRALTSTQCLLERIRSGEADRQAHLLLSEMSRLLTAASSSSPGLTAQWAAALDAVELLRGDYLRGRTSVSMGSAEATAMSHHGHEDDVAMGAVPASY
jgi:hypothetical protein